MRAQLARVIATRRQTRRNAGFEGKLNSDYDPTRAPAWVSQRVVIFAPFHFCPIVNVTDFGRPAPLCVLFAFFLSLYLLTRLLYAPLTAIYLLISLTVSPATSSRTFRSAAPKINGILFLQLFVLLPNLSSRFAQNSKLISFLFPSHLACTHLIYPFE